MIRINIQKTQIYTILLSVLVLFSSAWSSEQVIFMKPASDKDVRYVYPVALLKEVMQVTKKEFGPAEVAYSSIYMKRKRGLLEIEKGERVHLSAEAVKPEWEKKLIPIYVPLRKGIQGFRTFLTIQKNKDLMANIETLDELIKIPTGSGVQWSTTRILKESNFNVVTSINYEGLFAMLIAGRFATFNRGINETLVEFNERKDEYPELTIDTHVALFTPLPTYYFVSPNKPALVERIRIGLNVLRQNGTFDRQFWKYHRKLVDSADLDHRRIFSIPNPNLSDSTPLKDDSLWYRPKSMM